MTKDAVQTLAGGAEDVAGAAGTIAESVTETAVGAATEMVREL